MMTKQPFPLTPKKVKVLIECPLHYHFLQQESDLPHNETQTELDLLLREAISYLHTGGGPARLSLQDCLKKVKKHPQLEHIVEHYYHRLEHDWATMIAANEPMSLKISIAGVALKLKATLDRLDKTSDGGILAIIFRPEKSILPTSDNLRRNPTMTIYHALVASTYPLKRPVRIQELWLHHNQAVTIELSEAEYRHNLGRLREPVRALAQGEVMARPGLHCDVCPFKQHGCPVYAQDPASDSEADDFAPTPSDGKISPRKWIFKI